MRITILILIFILGTLIGCVSDDNVKDSTISKVIDSINGEPVVPRDANRIIVPFFNNFTTEFSISEKLTLRVREFLVMDGRLAVVSDNKDADLRLIGKIVRYHNQPIQYGKFGEPIRKRLRIVAMVGLLDLRRDREIFCEREIQSFEIYSDLIPPITSEIQIRDKALDSLARRISITIIKGWYTDLMTPAEKGKR